MSNDSHPAKLFCETCILFTAVMLLQREFPDIPDIGGRVTLANMFANISILVIAISLVALLFVISWIVSGLLFLVHKMAKNVGLKLTDASQNLGQKAEPPIIAEFLVGLFAKRRYRNGLLQSLEADFESDLAAGASVRRARSKYWSAALRSIWPQAKAWAKRIGIIGLIADYARRLLH